VDKWPAAARLVAVAAAGHLPTAPTPHLGARPGDGFEFPVPRVLEPSHLICLLDTVFAFCRRDRRRIGTEAISRQRKEAGGLPSLYHRRLHTIQTGRFPVCTSPGPSHVRRISSATVAPTNAFPWRKPDAIHRRYLKTSPRHCPGARRARCLTAARLSAASPLPLTGA
jgi:hypothetical protein